MGAGGTWRAVFRKHVLIAFIGENLFSEQQNIKKFAIRGARSPEREARASPEDYSN
jgi:hypothetical protein